MSTVHAPVEQVQAPVERCANCNALLTGEFCAVCGEHRRHARDLSLGFFLRRTFHNLTNIDANFVASIRYLVTRPGFLTREYIEGRRRRYLQPLDLFLLINLFYFLVQSVAPMPIFTTSLGIHLHSTMHQEIAQRLVSQKIRKLTPPAADSVTRRNIDGAYAAQFDANTRAQAKSLVILMVPLFALVMALLYAGTDKPAVQHLIFSLHFYSWFLLLLVAYSIGLHAVFSVVRLLHIPDNHGLLRSDIPTSILLAALFTTYLSFAMRRVYDGGRYATLLRTVGGLFGVIFALFFYRMVLFFTVFYTT